METTADIYRALLDGKKIRKKRWATHDFISMEEGCLFDTYGNLSKYHFCESYMWEIYDESEEIKELNFMDSMDSAEYNKIIENKINELVEVANALKKEKDL